jgi:hypothetical protein
MTHPETDHTAIAVRDREAAIRYHRDSVGAEVHPKGSFGSLIELVQE